METRQPVKNLALFLCLAVYLLTVAAVPAFATAAEKPQPKTLFTNVHVFDGVSDKRIEKASVFAETTFSSNKI